MHPKQPYQLWREVVEAIPPDSQRAMGPEQPPGLAIEPPRLHPATPGAGGWSWAAQAEDAHALALPMHQHPCCALSCIAQLPLQKAY